MSSQMSIEASQEEFSQAVVDPKVVAASLACVPDTTLISSQLTPTVTVQWAGAGLAFGGGQSAIFPAARLDHDIDGQPVVKVVQTMGSIGGPNGGSENNFVDISLLDMDVPWQAEMARILRFVTPEGVENARKIGVLARRFGGSIGRDLDKDTNPLFHTLITPTKHQVLDPDGNVITVELIRQHKVDERDQQPVHTYKGLLTRRLALAGREIRSELVPDLAFEFHITDERVDISFGPANIQWLTISWAGGAEFVGLNDVNFLGDIHKQFGLKTSLGVNEVLKELQRIFSRMLDDLLIATKPVQQYSALL